MHLIGPFTWLVSAPDRPVHLIGQCSWQASAPDWPSFCFQSTGLSSYFLCSLPAKLCFITFCDGLIITQLFKRSSPLSCGFLWLSTVSPWCPYHMFFNLCCITFYCHLHAFQNVVYVPSYLFLPSLALMCPEPWPHHALFSIAPSAGCIPRVRDSSVSSVCNPWTPLAPPHPWSHALFKPLYAMIL